MPPIDKHAPAEAEAPAPPRFGPDGKLTREGMERAIAEGGSVLFNGRHISTLDDLPTEVDLAGDDEAKRAAALETLLAQQAALSAQFGQLGLSPAPAKAVAPGEAPEVAALRAQLDKERADRQAAEAKLGHAEADRRAAEAKLAEASKPAPAPAPAVNVAPAAPTVKDKAK